MGEMNIRGIESNNVLAEAFFGQDAKEVLWASEHGRWRIAIQRLNQGGFRALAVTAPVLETGQIEIFGKNSFPKEVKTLSAAADTVRTMMDIL